METRFRHSTAATLLSITLAAPCAQADTFAGVFVGAQLWDTSADGSFGTSSDLEKFDLEDETKGSVWIAVEHFIPFVPNVKLRHNQLDTDGDANVTDFEFGGTIYEGAATIDAELDHTDIILYYEILDNDTVALDLGLNLKWGDYKLKLNGETTLPDDTTATVSSSESYDGVIPMIYAAGSVGLPFVGVGVFGELNWIDYDDSDATDIQLGGFWHVLDNPAIQATLQLGYRRLEIDVDDVGDIYADADWDGAFVGVQLHF